MVDAGLSETKRKVMACAKAICGDREFQCLLTQSGADHSAEDVAGDVAGLLWVLPIKSADKLYGERRKFEREVERFRRAVERYERRTQDSLPSPSTVLYRRLDEELSEHVVRRLPTIDTDEYLEELGLHPFAVDGGTWVLPRLETRTGQWPRNDTSAAEVWIIRCLDDAGVRLATDKERTVFLDLACRLIDLVCDYTPNPIQATRKTLQNHSAFDDLQESRKNWPS